MKGLEKSLEKNVKDFKAIMSQLGLKPNRKLGQVFLIDEKVINDQIEFAQLTKKDTVLEIGPGLGLLTTILAQHARKVIAVEFDKKLCSYLADILPDNVIVICADALSIDFPKFNKIVSNVPYQISSPLIFKLIDHRFDLGIFLFQEEFANRLNAVQNTKNYSRLTVMSSYYYDIDLLQYVPSTSFLPVPKINSAIIKIVPKKNKETANNEELFTNLVKVVFNERRKMIKNSLSNQFAKICPPKLDLTKSEISDIIVQLPNRTARPEQLSLSQLIQMSNTLHQALTGSITTK